MALTKVSYSMIDGASVNVKDFGAVGDGVTDDTAAVQAAINYCLSFEIPTVKGQSLIPQLCVSGMCLITSTLNIDRTEPQSSQFRIVGDGVVGGFVVNTAITIFSTTFAGSNAATPASSVLSNQITFENLTFQGQSSVEAYAIDLPKYVRTYVTSCFFNRIALCKTTTGYIQTAYLDKCFARYSPYKFITTVDAYDMSISESFFEACQDSIFTATGAVSKFVATNNLCQTISTGNAHFVRINTTNGATVSENYIENLAGNFVKVDIGYGLTVSNNYINTRAATPNNRADTTFFEVWVVDAQSFTGFGNYATHRLYRFDGTTKNANIGAGDRAGVNLQNTTQFITNKSVGAQTTDAFGLIKNYASTSFQYMAYASDITANRQFCLITLGTKCGTAIISAVTSGFQPGFDAISHIQRWLVTTNSAGTVTVTLVESQGVTVNSLTATVSGQNIVLTWIYRATLGRASFLNTSTEVSAVAGGESTGAEIPTVS